jgi:hypothetical protein
MASSISIKSEYRLEGAANFNEWKLRITNILLEHDLERYATTVVEESTTNAGRVDFRKSQAKANRIIFDSVKDSIVQEHDLERYATTVVEEPTTNAGRADFRKSQAKAKRIIFDLVKKTI